MSFTIPNAPSAAFTDQAEVDSVDFDILLAGVQGAGVLSGCAVTAQGSPNMTVAVAAGSILIAGAVISVTGGNVTITAANATNPRFDLVVVNNAGTKSAVAGTASSNPVFPAIPANSVVLAAVYVPANDTAINSTQIVDKRVTVSAPVSQTALWTTLSRSTDLTRTNTTTFADDPVLTFSMIANTKYRIRGRAYLSTGNANPDAKVTLNGPAGASLIVITYRTNNAQSALSDVTPANAYGVVATLGSTSAMVGAIYEFEALIHNGANAGAFALQWAQNVLDAVNGTTINAGSYIEYSVA